MKNTKVQRAFLEALKPGLWDTPLDHTLFEGLDRHDWISVFRLSFNQTVEGMIADSIRSLPDSLMPPQDLLLKWIVRLQRIEQKNDQMNLVIRQIFDILNTNNIEAILQKGHGLSLYYEKPNQRVCGDIDVYFLTREHYDRANELMSSAGENFSIDPAFSSSYIFSEMEIEHHQRLVQLRNPLVNSAIRSLHAAEDRKALSVNLAGKDIPIPSPLLNIIQVNAHILKHQVTYGIGLRQLCDSARLYHTFSGQIDGEELKSWYKKLGMLNWTYTFHEVLVDLLGLDRSKLPFEPKTKPEFRWMSEEIMRSGNFGFHDPAHPDYKKPRGRVNRAERLSKNFMRYVRLAPMEAISFPFFQFYSKIFR